jgi:cobalamin biosynthesis protein CobT
MNEYLWNKVVSKNSPSKWGPKLEDKLNAVISICKWPTQFEPKARKDGKLNAEYEWFRDWLNQYLTGKLSARDAMLRAIAHLEEDPDTKREMDKVRSDEGELEGLLRDERLFGEGVRRALEKMRGKGVAEPCPAPHGEAKLDHETEEEIERLVREEYTRDKLPGYAEMTSGIAKGAPSVAIQRPETNEVPPLRPNPLVNRMKHAFRFRKARPMYSNRLLRSGNMDEEELWRTLGNDLRVFEQRVIEEDPETQVTLLVDASGSMSGPKIETATMLASVLLECLKDMKGVRVRVRAHTSENGTDYTVDSSGRRSAKGGGVLHIYRIWEPGDEVRRINLMPELPMTANYDGFAIAWCAEEMLKESRPGEDMVMIVIADGLPAGGSGFYYHGEDAIRHVRKIVDEYKRKNVHIIQLAIDPSVGPFAQEKMFGDSFIPYKDDNSLPRQMTEFLIRLFGNNQ